MSYKVYELSYYGQVLDFTTYLKDSRQALFAAMDVVMNEMGVLGADGIHPSRIAVLINRDKNLIGAMMSGIELKILGVIDGDDEQSLDWALKLIKELNRLKDNDSVCCHRSTNSDTVKLAQLDHTLRKLVDQSFDALTGPMYSPFERNEFREELKRVTTSIWTLLQEKS